jgi:hypothetical protein
MAAITAAGAAQPAAAVHPATYAVTAAAPRPPGHNSMLRGLTVPWQRCAGYSRGQQPPPLHILGEMSPMLTQSVERRITSPRCCLAAPPPLPHNHTPLPPCGHAAPGTPPCCQLPARQHTAPAHVPAPPMALACLDLDLSSQPPESLDTCVGVGPSRADQGSKGRCPAAAAMAAQRHHSTTYYYHTRHVGRGCGSTRLLSQCSAGTAHTHTHDPRCVQFTIRSPAQLGKCVPLCLLAPCLFPSSPHHCQHPQNHAAPTTTASTHLHCQPPPLQRWLLVLVAPATEQLPGPAGSEDLQHCSWQ